MNNSIITKVNYLHLKKIISILTAKHNSLYSIVCLKHVALKLMLLQYCPLRCQNIQVNLADILLCAPSLCRHEGNTDWITLFTVFQAYVTVNVNTLALVYTIQMRHCPVANCQALQCLTNVLPKPFRSKALSTEKGLQCHFYVTLLMLNGAEFQPPFRARSTSSSLSFSVVFRAVWRSHFELLYFPSL